MNISLHKVMYVEIIVRPDLHMIVSVVPVMIFKYICSWEFHNWLMCDIGDTRIQA